MNRRAIPAIIMLIGGFCSCVIGILNHMDSAAYMKMLFIVLIIFYIIGCIVKVIIDKNFPEMTETEDTEENGETDENNEGVESEETAEDKEE